MLTRTNTISHVRFARVASLAMLASCPIAWAQTVNVPPAELPDQAWFLANPGATINVLTDGVILPDNDEDPFDFNGATVNVTSSGAQGWFSIAHFAGNGTFNISGGKLWFSYFEGSLGPTVVNISSGEVRSRITLRGDTECNISGGRVGFVAAGSVSLDAEDESVVNMTDGTLDSVVFVRDNAEFNLSGGTVGTGFAVSNEGIANLTGGSIGRDGRLVDVDSVLNVDGAFVGRDFLVEHGTVNLSSGTFDTNAGMVNSGGIDPIFNMTGGALGSSFRAFDGTINISGGIVGAAFRLGRPTGDGSGATCNLFVKSATIDGVPIPLTPGATHVVIERGGAFLSCVLGDDSLMGFHLNDGSVHGEDQIRAGALLTLTLAELDCQADWDGSGGAPNSSDFLAYLNAWSAHEPAADLAPAGGDGAWDSSDFLEFLNLYAAGC